MRHRVKKIKFKGGHDATRMITRQLLRSFITEGKITSSPTKIAVLRSRIEVLVHKAKNNSQADRNVILSSLGDQKLANILQERIVPVFKDRTGGYVRAIKLSNRSLDGKLMTRLEWVDPVILVDKKPEKTETKEVKTESSKKAVIAKAKTADKKVSTAAKKAKK